MCKFLLPILLLSFSVQADIYQWQDKNGTTVFSDMPRPNAQIVELTPVQTYHQSGNTSASQPTLAADNNEAVPQKISYQNVQITNLKDQATLRNNNAIPFTMNVEIKPSLAANDLAILHVDGKQVGNAVKGPGDNVNFALAGLKRGSHQLQVQIMAEASKNLLAQSKLITVYFQQSKTQLLQG